LSQGAFKISYGKISILGINDDNNKGRRAISAPSHEDSRTNTAAIGYIAIKIKSRREVGRAVNRRVEE
jgi:hypothetical protein